MLYIGEKVGTGQGPKIDIALDPLEGTTITAKACPTRSPWWPWPRRAGSSMRPTPTWTRSRSAAGCPNGSSISMRAGGQPKGAGQGQEASKSADHVVCILDRPRHADLIAKVRAAGARIMLITDGDVAGVIAHLRSGERRRHLYRHRRRAGRRAGRAALRCIGGQMQGRLLFRNEDEKARATTLGANRPDRKYALLDLAHGDVMFAATGVTDGTMLKGVRRFHSGAMTHSMVMRSKSGTVRLVEATHNFERKTGFDPVER